MNEIPKIKKQLSKIIEGSSSEFTVLEHEHLRDDVWNITVESEITKRLYSFKNDGFESFDFKEKKSE